MDNPAKNKKSVQTYDGYDEILDVKNKQALVRCRRCRHQYMHPRWNPSTSSTNNLNRHRRGCFKRPQTNSSVPVVAATTITSLDLSQQDIRTMFNTLGQEQLEEVLMQCLVASNWSFRQFSVHPFQKLLSSGFPKLHPPSARIMRLRFPKYAEEARADIKKRFKENLSRISLALDCWTSPNRLEFMGM